MKVCVVKAKFHRQKTKRAYKGLRITAVQRESGTPGNGGCQGHFCFLKAVLSVLTILHRNRILFWTDA